MKILGLADLFAALMLVSRGLGIKIPIGILIVVLIYLVGKAMLSLLSIGGLIDMGTVILLIISSFVVLPPLALYIGAIIIGQKGILSMISFS